MCEYGLLPFWIRVCHEYHTNHCYAFQPKIALFRKWMIDMAVESVEIALSGEVPKHLVNPKVLDNR